MKKNDPNTLCDCDRTLYFNTGYKYPDGPLYLSEFRGKEDSMFDMASIDWDNRSMVWDRLQSFQHPFPPFESFPSSKKGTKQLFAFTTQQTYPPAFAFGLLLWHQMGYKPNLQVVYQTGQCGSQQCWHRLHSR